MAGGIWKTQNKVRPGAYINFKNEIFDGVDLKNGGIVTVPLAFNFGAEQEVSVVTKKTNLEFFGEGEGVLLLQEALKRAKVVLVYRLNTGGKAHSTVNADGQVAEPKNVQAYETGDGVTIEWDPVMESTGELTIRAKHGGSFGNHISVTCQENVDGGSFRVATYVKGEMKDIQTVTHSKDLKANDYVVFEGYTELFDFTTALNEGTDDEVTAEDYAGYFETIEAYQFNYMALPVEDDSIKQTAIEFITRLRDEEGEKCQLVVSNVVADHEAVINVTNGVVLENGTIIHPHHATVWVAGASAVCELGKSLTYQAYDGAVNVYGKLTSKETELAILSHEFVFTEVRGRVVVETDINTLHTYTEDVGKVWSKNEAVRIFDYIANNTKQVFEDNFIGKVVNNANGREAFRADRIGFFNELESREIIQDFDKETVVVNEGEEKDSMTLTAEVKVLNTLEKLYMTVSTQ